MTAYYNEHDPFAAAWLRELIKANLIALGEVDERSIEDIKPSELKGYTQCHFFAGIGVWSYALRQAGWADDREVWTGSCPCQPFSAAGKRGGTSDERHLWPAWYHLAEKCRPSVIFGEQVASKDGLAWLDLVSSDLEAADYTVGAVDTCAAGVGAPHIRQRLYFVGHSTKKGLPFRTSKEIHREETRGQHQRSSDVSEGMGNAKLHGPSSKREFGRTKEEGRLFQFEGSSSASELANPSSRTSERNPGSISRTKEKISKENGAQHGNLFVGHPDGSTTSFLAESNGGNSGTERIQRSGIDGQQSEDSGTVWSATSGFWREADWIPCIDGKARPIEPGTFPLATGVANRVGLLRGYGNSLTAPVAQAFIESYLEVIN